MSGSLALVKPGNCTRNWQHQYVLKYKIHTHGHTETNARLLLLDDGGSAIALRAINSEIRRREQENERGIVRTREENEDRNIKNICVS